MKRFLKGLGIFLALIGVGIVSAFAVVALLLQQQEVRVPDLSGQDIVAAINILSQQGLQIKVDRREPHPTLPRDAVISQSPAAGSGIKKGRQILVVVSQGPSDLLAPKLVGEYYRKADIMIRQLGFFPGTVSRVSSDSVEQDVVIAQDPQPGSQLDKAGRVSLLVSAGKRANAYVMPKLIGKSPEAALKIVDRIGLQHRFVYKSAGDNRSAVRFVIGQKPAAGTPVTIDTSVDIIVSK